MRALAALAVIALVVPAAAAPCEDANAAIMAVMRDSAAGWTARDLDRFMAVYAEDATFVVGDGVIRGKAAIAARYAPRFAPEAAAKRGALSFEQMAFRPIDPSHALLVARYRLKVAGAADQTGPTSLLFEKQREGWKIVADHSS
ncbi:MAG: SgcJ/EcaC family oxidoreductase [Sphingomonas sp.]|jgi:uncharacterized protein (TIGR02246 family)|uniref:YybH family protein n=1 Tax=Sphingomonas sp. TaxID=28214 RepID=UPI003569C302